jgi:hypothetical protein
VKEKKRKEKKRKEKKSDKYIQEMPFLLLRACTDEYF